jgi:methionine-rich copper-binding protein CopC
MFLSRSPQRRRFLAGVAACLLTGLLSSAHPASAHAIVVKSNPAANGEVPLGLLDILLQFNSRVQIDLSRVSLVDPGGKVTQLSLTPGAASGSIAAQATVDQTGAWKLRWQVLSVDGHITRGEIPFTVAAKAAS